MKSEEKETKENTGARYGHEKAHEMMNLMK